MEGFDNYKIFIYIILFILYLIFSGKKKKKEPAKPQNIPPVIQQEKKKYESQSIPKPIVTQSKETPPAEKPSPFSLEDILKEFETTISVPESKSSQETKPIVVEDLEKPITQTIDYDEDLKDEIEDLEEEASVQGTHSLVNEPADTDEHFQPYSLSGKKKNIYAAMLKDPQGIKTAFVASEIFNRKYF